MTKVHRHHHLDRRVGQVLAAAPVTLPSEERSLTIEQFCFLESIGKNSFYKMKRRGTAPEIYYVPVGTARLPRISAQAHRDWRAKLKALRLSEADELLAQRKQAQTVQAGKLAAASPLHVSRHRRRRR
jgi:hypothetical protein